jgi:phosphatidylserine/phosphatidylglycerophosphate/cardiolipin synthase-like enzyme
MGDPSSPIDDISSIGDFAPLLPVAPILPIGTILLAPPFKLAELPLVVQQAIARGKSAWLDAMKTAIAQNIRDPKKLADIIFFMQHPDRVTGGVGRLIDPKDADFIKTSVEWILYFTIVSRMLDARFKPSVFLPEQRATTYEDFIAAQATGRITLMVNGRDSDGTGTIDAKTKVWTGGFKDDTSTFDAMQQTVESLGKGDGLFIANWQFSPQRVPLTLPRTGIATWGDLLAKKANEGVTVRVLIAQHPFYMTDFLTNFDELDAKVLAQLTDKDRFKYLVTAPPGIHGVHHQKFMVARKGQSLVTFCGGLDVSSNRTPGTPAAPRWSGGFVWHDTAAKLEGNIAHDLEREFVQRWNRERTESKRPPLAGWKTPEKLATTPGGEGGGSSGQKLQMVRTVAAGNGPLSIATQRDDIWRAYFRLIGRATRFLYLEDQYFHSPELGDAIAKQAQAVAELLVIVVVGTGSDDPTTAPVQRAYHQNQMRFRFDFFNNLLGGIPKDRVRVYTLNYPGGITHTKLVIADDEALTVGSANANPRGFFLDSELNVVLDDAQAVTDFRHRLWSHNLHVPVPDVARWKIGEFIARWDEVAKRNGDVATKNAKNVGMPAMLVGDGVIPFHPLDKRDRRFDKGEHVKMPIFGPLSLMPPEWLF